MPVLVDSRYRLLDYHGMTTCTPNESEVEQILGIKIDDDLNVLRFNANGQHRGMPETCVVSALHGRGVEELVDLCEKRAADSEEAWRSRRRQTMVNEVKEAVLEEAFAVLEKYRGSSPVLLACRENGSEVYIKSRRYSVAVDFALLDSLKELLGDSVDEIFPVQLPYWTGPQDCLHLLSFISIVDKDLAVVYSRLMPVPFRELILAMGFKLVEVPDEEYDSLGCNVLAVAPRQSDEQVDAATAQLFADAARAGEHERLGDALALASMAFWGAYTVLLRMRHDDLDTPEFLTLLCAMGLATMLPWVAWEWHHEAKVSLSAAGALAVVYSAVGSLLLAGWGWTYVVKRIGASHAGVTMHLMPGIAVVLSMVFLGEYPSWYHGAGIALILSGVALSSWARLSA